MRSGIPRQSVQHLSSTPPNMLREPRTSEAFAQGVLRMRRRRLVHVSKRDRISLLRFEVWDVVPGRFGSGVRGLEPGKPSAGEISPHGSGERGPQKRTE